MKDPCQIEKELKEVGLEVETNPNGHIRGKLELFGGYCLRVYPLGGSWGGVFSPPFSPFSGCEHLFLPLASAPGVRFGTPEDVPLWPYPRPPELVIEGVSALKFFLYCVLLASNAFLAGKNSSDPDPFAP